jgi:magnesium and cobalt transporter
MKKFFSNLQENLAAKREFLRQAEALRPHLPQLYAAFAERDMAPLTHHERELLENALAFGALVADDVAVPRASIIAAPEVASLNEVLHLFAETQHSRLPVMGRDLDDLKGFVLLKDVIQHLQTPTEFTLTTLLRPLTVVPESMPLPRVLQQMKRTKVPFVLVADEFGGTSGLISLKDILEQLVGSIADENTDQAEAILSLGSSRYRIKGETPLADIDRSLGTNLNEAKHEDATTLAGLVLQAAQHIPAKGEVVTLPGGLLAETTETDGRRVLLVTLSLPKGKDA